MTRIHRWLAVSGSVALLATPVAAFCDDLDALSLKSAPVQQAPAEPNPMRLFVEGAAGTIDQRDGLPSLDARRLSVDFKSGTLLSPGWRAVLSNRVDYIEPPDIGTAHTVNSLREAYASWQATSGKTIVDAGRVNLRNGPAYGYNPTDYFRDGALRDVTSPDPILQRENRLGTAMLRGQYIWGTSSASLAVAPKLASEPSSSGFSADLGATNNRDRALITFSGQYSDRVSGQALLLADDRRGPQFGLNGTALLSDAAVAFFEWSRGRDDDVLSLVTTGSAARITGNRVATGLTYTTATRLSLTAEYEYNGFAIDRSTWLATAASEPDALGTYLLEVQRRQDNASRRAYLVYATQTSAFWKSLDATALMRIDADDHSWLGWLELRYHWRHTDLALQWQQSGGGRDTEYGSSAYRRTLQLVGAYYF